MDVLNHRGPSVNSTYIKEGNYFGLVSDQVEEKNGEILLFDGLEKPSEGFNIEEITTPFALAHFKEDTLTLARDPLGAKPLYWTFQEGLFLFASELKSLIATKLFVLRLDQSSLSHYLSLGYCPINRTPFKEINKVLPGHKLIFSKEKEIFIRPFFSLSYHLRDKKTDWSEEEFDKIVNQNFIKRDLEQKNVGRIHFEHLKDSKLSSSCKPLEIPSISFSEIAQNLPKLLWYQDEPLASSKMFSFYRLMQEAKNQNCTDVVLEAGSLNWLNRHIHSPKLHMIKFSQLNRRFLHALLLSPPLRYFHPGSYYSFLRRLNTHPYHTKYILNQFIISPSEIQKLTKNKLSATDPEIIFHTFPPFENMGTSFSSLFYLYQKTSLTNKYLMQYDRLALPFNITCHTPYLDKNALIYLTSMPEERMQKLFSRISKPRRKKNLFAMTTILDQEKSRFLFSLLKKGVIVDNGIIDPKALDALLRKNLDHPNSIRPLWALLILEVWLRIFFETPLSIEPPEISLEELLRS